MCFKEIWNYITSHADPDYDDDDSVRNHQIASIILKKQSLMDHRQKSKRPKVFNKLNASSWFYIETLMLPFILNVFQHQESTNGTTLQNMNYFYEYDCFISLKREKHKDINVVIDKSSPQVYNYNDFNKAKLVLNDIKQSVNDTTEETICRKLLETLPNSVFNDKETDIFAKAYCFFYQKHYFELKHKIDRNNKNVTHLENYEWLYDFLIIENNKDSYTTKSSYFVSKLDQFLSNSFKYYKIRELMMLENLDKYLAEKDYSNIFDRINKSCNLSPTKEHFIETMEKINTLSKK